MIKQWKKCGSVADQVWGTYFENCEFPKWSATSLAKGLLDPYAKTVVAYYTEGDDPGKALRMMSQREPANVGMHRCYDEDLFEARFGWRRGAYAESTESELMPNIAIYCRTPMQSSTGERKDVHVINVVGYAFDSKEQPDWKYFLPLHTNREKWDELVRRMQQMWRYIYECAKRHQLKRVYLADIGGGAFSTGLQMYEETSYELLKEASLPPVQQEYEGVLETHQLQRIPDWCFTEEAESLLSESLLVNAWDPWSLVGNANNGDNSLDGFFGRCTAMGVLCWPKTNPYIKMEVVAPR